MPNCSNCLPTCHDSTYLMDYDTVPDSNSFTKDGSGHIDVFYKDLGAIKYRRERAFTFMQLIGKYHYTKHSNSFMRDAITENSGVVIRPGDGVFRSLFHKSMVHYIANALSWN
ncbi:hypothetical protein ANN_07455 [Periplaneta americana]|uniref:Uncharacterized protein n=1 Tax=Periplaneta americana TaxID=6978 RepID=A0ABQ8SYN6_PERAM|nr:hypothetical protein ANN_07455 [Periplaneta americana]